MGSGGAKDNLTTLKMGWSRLIDGGRRSQYAPLPTWLLINNGPNLWWESFSEGWVVWMSLASRKTILPPWTPEPGTVSDCNRASCCLLTSPELPLLPPRCLSFGLWTHWRIPQGTKVGLVQSPSEEHAQCQGGKEGVEWKSEAVVILEFHKWQQPHPIILSLVGEESEILFQFLVDPFRLSVPLRVVCRGGCQLNSEQPVEFPGEFCYKLGTSIRDDFPRETVMFPYMV